MKKAMIIIFIAGFILMAGLLVIERGRYKKLEAKASAEKEKLSELEKQNHGLDIRLKMISKMNQELEQKLAGLERERADLNRKLKESEERIKKIQAGLEAMTPDDMVQETRRILKDAGVDRIDAGARFSLAAFRKNASILLEWEEFSLARIPLLEQKTEVLEKENLHLRNQVFLWKEADRLWQRKSTLWLEEKVVMNGLIINYERQISSQKRQKWYLFALGALAGFAGHALLK